MISGADYSSNIVGFENNLREFIRVEVETATTFANAAITTGDSARRQEDRAKARKAYDTAMHFLAEANQRFPSHPLPSATIAGLEQLKKTLEKLGERF